MQRIIIYPDICGGQPTIKGTRIASRTVLGYLSAGDTIEDILACLAFSADLLKNHYSVQDVTCIAQ